MKTTTTPVKRRCQRRLTPHLKSIRPKHRLPLLLDPLTAKAFHTYGNKHGWDTRQRQVKPGLVQCWRVR